MSSSPSLAQCGSDLWACTHVAEGFKSLGKEISWTSIILWGPELNSQDAWQASTLDGINAELGRHRRLSSKYDLLHAKWKNWMWKILSQPYIFNKKNASETVRHIWVKIKIKWREALSTFWIKMLIKYQTILNVKKLKSHRMSKLRNKQKGRSPTSSTGEEQESPVCHQEAITRFCKLQQPYWNIIFQHLSQEKNI